MDHSFLDMGHYSLEKFFEQNKFFVHEEERAYLEQYVIMGIPENMRRQYWLTVSGAYGYMQHYCDGYYKSLSSEGNNEAYPNWPHPDYVQINKDI